jgi:hypothetical protein
MRSGLPRLRTANFVLAGVLAVPCASPMLLIRNAVTPATSAFPNPWFAGGIYRPQGSSDH